tara:strand:+ start:5176 stop:5883 length:708 start_codon:yes stop_codon:yes gene_type:complete
MENTIQSDKEFILNLESKNQSLFNGLQTELNADFGAVSLLKFAIDLREWLTDNINGYDSDKLQSLTKSDKLGSYTDYTNTVNNAHLYDFLNSDILRFNYMQTEKDYPNNPFIIGYYKAEKYAEKFNLSADKMINYLQSRGLYNGLSWENMLTMDAKKSFNYEFLLTKFVKAFILENYKILLKGVTVDTYDNWQFVFCSDGENLKLMTLKFKLKNNFEEFDISPSGKSKPSDSFGW